tara:strand:+ start:67 stop:1509 length:1443 start_codon:yes stop_codon:yes gene_type:complete
MSEDFINFIKPLSLWDGKSEIIYHDINNNYIGGHRVRIRKIEEIIYSEKTMNKIKMTFTKFILFIFNILIPLSLTISDITIRFIERPERNSEEFHNWSTLALIYVEFAILLINLSIFVVFLCSLLTNNLIARYILTKKYNENIEDLKKQFLYYAPYLFLIISIPFDLLIVFNVTATTIDEYTYFLNKESNNDTFIYINDTNFQNDTIIDYTNFQNFDQYFYIYLLIFYTLIGISTALNRLKNFNINYEKKDNNINFYDPDLTRKVIDRINKINGFSLLKFISWLRHECYDFIYLLFHKAKNNKKLLEIKNKDFCGFILLVIYLFICCVVVFISFTGLFLYLGSFGFIHRIKSVNFVGYLEPSNWSKIEFLKFFAFLNNILSLDTGKNKSYKTIMYFLFAGEDALEDQEEKKSQETFNNLLISYSLSEQGFFKTLVVFSQFNHKDIQKICIYQEENNFESIEIDEDESIEIENNEDIIPRP